MVSHVSYEDIEMTALVQPSAQQGSEGYWCGLLKLNVACRHFPLRSSVENDLLAIVKSLHRLAREADSSRALVRRASATALHRFN